MKTQYGDLLNDIPKYQDRIYNLKVNDAQFRRLLTEYQRLSSLVENLENAGASVNPATEKDYRYRKIRLEDELYQIIKDRSQVA